MLPVIALGLFPRGNATVLLPRQPFHVTPLLRHRMVALEDTDVVEVSTTELDDVVRLEDKYGRKGTSAP